LEELGFPWEVARNLPEKLFWELQYNLKYEWMVWFVNEEI
jgi:hypothetical protein